MNTIYGVDEIFLAEADDGTSDAIPISIDFPFGPSIQDVFYVSHITSLKHCRMYLFLLGGYKWTPVIWHCIQLLQQ